MSYQKLEGGNSLTGSTHSGYYQQGPAQGSVQSNKTAFGPNKYGVNSKSKPENSSGAIIHKRDPSEVSKFMSKKTGYGT